MTERPDLPAGEFSSWLRSTWTTLLDDSGADVPCGGCTACCTSSYFIHVGPDETRALARIPAELLFAAPDLPKGNVLMGYDEDGRCPMLTDGTCTIYEDRPLTCRNYDCRVYTAAGIDADRDLITRRARRWVFDYAAEEDRDQHAAVRAAARFVREHAECFPDGAVRGDPAQVAILAVKVYEVFLGHDEGPGSGETGRAARTRDAEIAGAVVAASEEFEAKRDAPGVRPGQVFRINRLLTP
jgi:Fe-S-cluster containining protein